MGLCQSRPQDRNSDTFESAVVEDPLEKSPVSGGTSVPGSASQHVFRSGGSRTAVTDVLLPLSPPGIHVIPEAPERSITSSDDDFDFSDSIDSGGGKEGEELSNGIGSVVTKNGTSTAVHSPAKTVMTVPSRPDTYTPGTQASESSTTPVTNNKTNNDAVKPISITKALRAVTCSKGGANTTPTASPRKQPSLRRQQSPPLVQLSQPLEMIGETSNSGRERMPLSIPEEEDPEAPSDEEEYREDLVRNTPSDEPGRLVPIKAKHSRTTTPGSIWHPPPPSSDDCLPCAYGSEASRSLEGKGTNDFNKKQPDSAVKYHTLSQFNRLKLQVQLAAREEKKKARVAKLEDRVKDVQGYRKLWKEYQEILDEVNSLEHQENTKKLERRDSFDLKDTNAWFFDFQSAEFPCHGGDGDENASQSNLSLLSESSMEAQRQLYAEKRRERRKGQGRGRRRSRSKTHAKNRGSFEDSSASRRRGVNNAIFTSSRRQPEATPPNDYGPIRRCRSTPQLNRSGSNTSLTNMEVSFTTKPPSTVETRPLDQGAGGRADDCSLDDAGSWISDLNDEHSCGTGSTMSAVATGCGFGNNDYRVVRRHHRRASSHDAASSLIFSTDAQKHDIAASNVATPSGSSDPIDQRDKTGLEKPHKLVPVVRQKVALVFDSAPAVCHVSPERKKIANPILLERKEVRDVTLPSPNVSEVMPDACEKRLTCDKQMRNPAETPPATPTRQANTTSSEQEAGERVTESSPKAPRRRYQPFADIGLGPRSPVRSPSSLSRTSLKANIQMMTKQEFLSMSEKSALERAARFEPIDHKLAFEVGIKDSELHGTNLIVPALTTDSATKSDEIQVTSVAGQNSDESDTGRRSILFAEEVAAQVKDVLYKYRASRNGCDDEVKTS